MQVVTASASRILGLNQRDRRIIDLALSKVRGARADFGEAMQALREAVEELIPDGRVFLLGTTDAGPIVGSLVSGVGIVDGEHGIEVIRAERNGSRTALGWFAR